MDSQTLQSLAGLIYMRAETFESYLARSETDVAQQLQKLIGGLDRSRRAMLMQKLSAVSGRHATPVILAWTAASLQQQLGSLLNSSKQGADPATQQLVRQQMLDLARSAAHAAGKGSTAFPSESALLTWFLNPKTPCPWELILQMPGMEHVLRAAADANPQLQLAFQVLGLDNPSQGSLHEQLSKTVAGLIASSRQSIAQALGSSEGNAGAQNLDLLGKAAGGAASAGPQLASAAAGLALARWASAKLGLALLPDAQLVTRLLRASPFHVQQAAQAQAPSSASGEGATEGAPGQGLQVAAAAVAAAAEILPELLLDAAQQLAKQSGLDSAVLLREAAAAAASPWQHQGQADPAVDSLLAAAAGAHPDGPAAQLMSKVYEWRKAMLLAGVPSIMGGASAQELGQLSAEELRLVQAVAHRLDATGGALEQLVLPGPSAAGTGAQDVDLESIQSLSLDLRLALAWRLRTPSASRQAAQRLLQGLHRSSMHRHHEHSRQADSFDTLVKAFALERQVAELDLFSFDRLSLPAAMGPEALLTAGQGNSQLRLPTEGSLRNKQASKGVAGNQALPVAAAGDGELALFDSLLDGEGVDEAQVLSAFEILIQGMEGQEDLPSTQEIPATFREWFTKSKLAVNKLSPAMLALLRRFLSLKIRVSKGHAEQVQQRTRILLQAVQAEIQRVDRSAGTASTSGRGAPAASPYWLSLDGSRQQEAPPPPALPTALGTISEIDPDIVKSLLQEEEASEFSEWLRSVALQVATGPYDLLADQHMRMDMERYLLMRHHPELSISFEEAPLQWKDAGPRGIGSEEDFLERLKPGLSSYLVARGMAPLGPVEWEVYKQHALAEFSVMREANEEELREAGHSTFFNSRAEADYLRSLLVAGVPPSSPIHSQAHRYLTVLESNASWTFAQKKQLVQRLIDLSQHFSKQGAVSERGSPFAPLFSATGRSLVPNLPRKQRAAATRTAPAAQIPAGY